MNDDKMRAEFEAWAKAVGHDLSQTKGDDRYWFVSTESAWESWQAAYQAGQKAEREAIFIEWENGELLASEVERLRAELARCQSLLDQTKTELSICGAFHSLVKEGWQLELEKVNRLEAELAAAKAASMCPVNASWCYESNECDIVITGMSDEDSTKFGNWLRERMKERGEG